MKNGQKSIDLTGRRLIAMRDVQDALAAGANSILAAQNCVVTPSARDFLQQHGIELNGSGDAPAPSASAQTNSLSASAASGQSPVNRRLFSTPEAEQIKKEICAVGRKLWMRQFVDGNGGNISYRIGPNEVLCTPTLVSKFDLTPEDICLVDLEGNQIAGSKPRTSELLLHLEVYKAVPEAKAVLHCHPPHATAYAITGRVPPNMVIPEFEVFVGKVAISPYETPGTKAFAETVLPYVKQHNTVLLSNHGIVCWADTITHAEWYAEVLETYCWTLMLAAQLGVPISRISEEQGSDLLAIKKKLGLPDIRFDTSRMKECQLSDLEVPSSIALEPTPCDGYNSSGNASGADLEALVKSVTDAVMEAIAAG
ncbi:MAG: class II aldolase/adducin family protein [Terracidiphilus sp.]